MKKIQHSALKLIIDNTSGLTTSPILYRLGPVQCQRKWLVAIRNKTTGPMAEEEKRKEKRGKKRKRDTKTGQDRTGQDRAGQGRAGHRAGPILQMQIHTRPPRLCPCRPWVTLSLQHNSTTSTAGFVFTFPTWLKTARVVSVRLVSCFCCVNCCQVSFRLSSSSLCASVFVCFSFSFLFLPLSCQRLSALIWWSTYLQRVKANGRVWGRWAEEEEIQQQNDAQRFRRRKQPICRGCKRATLQQENKKGTETSPQRRQLTSFISVAMEILAIWHRPGPSSTRRVLYAIDVCVPRF